MNMPAKSKKKYPFSKGKYLIISDRMVCAFKESSQVPLHQKLSIITLSLYIKSSLQIAKSVNMD